MPGQYDEPFYVFLLCLLDKLQTIYPRHMDICNDEVRLKIINFLQCFNPIARQHDFTEYRVFLCDHIANAFQNDWLIIND
ncbi:hypothetical protein D3C78_1427060 [compost metagenome]